MSIIPIFKSARAVGTPIVSIRCADPENTMSSLQKHVNGSPVVQWDCITGIKSRNDQGEESLLDALDGKPIEITQNATEMMCLATKLHEGTILFMLNAHRFLDKHDFTQALWNLRDSFKASNRTAVLLGPDFTFPAELQQDVLVLDEPLPNESELTEILKDTIKAAELSSKAVATINIDKAVDAGRGLAAFPWEQAVAMSLSPQGLDIEGLWERKRQLISATKGLSVYKGLERFDAIGGCDQIKKFMRGIINGKDAPRIIVFLDEIEKSLSGAIGEVGDSSGTSQDALGQLLSFMEDSESDGTVFVGPPGSAKSMVAKATGNEAGIPTVILDLGGTRGSLVGESEQGIRNALKIVTAVGGGSAFFIATCNKIAVLPPELRRRFSGGLFFFDIPTTQERIIIWNIYLKQYGFERGWKSDIGFDKDWTGAEVRNCCRLAYRQGISLDEAAQYIVPVARSAPQQIESLRREAAGRYLSANHAGTYEFKTQSSEPITQRRKFAQEKV